MQREIKLDGGEITIIKALGVSGTALNGKLLLQRTGQMEEAEFIETLTGLMQQDYVLSSKVNVQNMEDIERSFFRVNSAHSRALRDALRPNRRREERPRRDRN